MPDDRCLRAVRRRRSGRGIGSRLRFEVQLELLQASAVVRVPGVSFRQVLANPKQLSDVDPQPGLFPHLPAGRLGRRLAGLDASTGQHMEHPPVVVVPDEEDSALLVHNDGSSADPRLGCACL
jgi:hypothetical protein